MNRERILALADAIEKMGPDKFFMGLYNSDPVYDAADLRQIVGYEPALPGCGTAACVAGHALEMFCEDDTLRVSWFVAERAADLLDLDSDVADRLFYGLWTTDPLEKITGAQTAAELRRMVMEDSRG